jgi:hypothetical protein
MDYKMFIYDEYSFTNRFNLRGSKRPFRLATRNLTIGEIAMCKTIFGDSIKYSEVKVHSDRIMIMGAMGLGGELYFPPKNFEADYSGNNIYPATKAWFIHEMTHVWQYQKGYPVGTIGTDLQVKRIVVDPYKYDITASIPDGNGSEIFVTFQNYNMESQAEILCHYYVLFVLKDNRGLNDDRGTFEYYNSSSTLQVCALRRQRLARIAGAFVNSKEKGSIWLPPKQLGYEGFLRK